MAVIALKLRLADHTDVSCQVQASSTDLLLRGSVGPVTVQGRGWQSGLGLTCRAIEATVETCQLDASRVMASRKLVLNQPARGKAMVSLNNQDFANFIVHPLLRPPQISNKKEGRIEFTKDHVVVDPSSKTVAFQAKYQGSSYQCILQRIVDEGRSRAQVNTQKISPGSVEEDDSLILSQSLTQFFNDMVFELDGTFLSFRDMMVTDKGTSPSVMISLNIIVEKFPSPGLAF